MDSTVVPRKTIDIIAAKQRRRQLCILLFAIVIMSDSAENTGSEQLTIRVKDQVRSDCTNSGFISFDLLPGAGSYRVLTSKVATASIWAVFNFPLLALRVLLQKETINILISVY